ncbi:MAG: BMP family ABC transporter substrate-binding protein [Armatimonadota bacterium]|nr:BMP family ABC transporter substrate-binding protein [Armatimonadota bacterium]MDR5698066.1 BMP family ABC transporter substrate-binding protein [Armatimonadota bacterium]
MRGLALLLCVAALAMTATAVTGWAAPQRPKVAFIYVGPIGDAGWTFQHDVARRHLQSALGADTRFVESVPETTEVRRVMEQLIRQGYKILFATAFGYQRFSLEVARQHPDVYIIGIGPAIGLAPRVKTIYGRIWEGRYLTGLVAGKMTRTNVVGFVAAHPISTVVAGVNAFALGVWETNPDAKIKVVWTRTWYDPPKEKAAAKALLDAGADIVAQHQDTPSALLAAAEIGKYGIGSESNMQRFAPNAYLTGTIWDWRRVNESIVRGILAGQFKSEDYYGGLADGVVTLGPLHPSVPADVRQLIERRRQAITDGTFQVFRGPLADQTGRVRVPSGKTMELREILGFDWLLRGIEGQAPTAR